MEDIMRKRREQAANEYEAMWDGGRGSHHQDFDPDVDTDDAIKASRTTVSGMQAVLQS